MRARSEKEEVVDKKVAEVTGLFHRSTGSKIVGLAAQLNRCLVSWGAAWQSGQRSDVACPTRNRYEANLFEKPERN